MFSDDATAGSGSRSHLFARGLLYWGMQAVFGVLLFEYVLWPLDRFDVFSILIGVGGLLLTATAIYEALTADDWDEALPTDRSLLLEVGLFALFLSARIGQVLGAA